MMNLRKRHLILYVLLFIIVCVPLFQDLGFLTIRNWDESRNIINAYEMFQNGNWLIPHYHGEPDMWNTKPPLLFWLQVISMKIIGVNELAFRLPSALAALFTCGILFLFLKSYLNNIYIAIFSVIVLITSTGYVRIHVARSGDFDALLIFFTTITALSFFLALNLKKSKYIYLFYIALTLAVLTKGIAGLLFLPAYFLYAAFSKNLKFIFTNKHFYLGLLILLIFGIGYYPLRELYNPGYLEAIYQNELGGRFQEGLEGNGDRPFHFYLQNIIEKDFHNYVILFLLGCVLTFVSKDKKIKQIVLFSILIISSFLLIISLAKTKLTWYDSPAYPFMSIIAGCGIYFLIHLLQLIFNQDLLKKSKIFSFKYFNYLIYGTIVVGLLVVPYLKILKRTSINAEPGWSRNIYKGTYFLRDALERKHDLNEIDNTLFVISQDERIKRPLEFYLKLLEERNVEIKIKNKEKLAPGDIVFAYEDDIKKFLEENYNYKVHTEYKDNINYLFLKKYEILRNEEN